jgi:hypothetical protein
MKNRANLLGFFLLLIGPACGPGPSSDADPEQIITAFCDNLFQCPETVAMLGYDSRDECETIHLNDYEIRDTTCRERVLMFEECLSELTCDDLADDRPCNEERSFLTERCSGL